MNRDMATTPIVNIIMNDKRGDQGKAYMNEYMMVCCILGQNRTPSKDAIKQRLGKQKYTINLTHRNWVWEDDTTGWRVYVDATGIGFEVLPGMTSLQAFEAWTSFRKALKITEQDMAEMRQKLEGSSFARREL